MTVPTYFETDHGTYDSEGVVYVPLQEVLLEYLRDFKSIDGGAHIDAFVDWLHDYACQLKRKSREVK